MASTNGVSPDKSHHLAVAKSHAAEDVTDVLNRCSNRAFVCVGKATFTTTALHKQDTPSYVTLHHVALETVPVLGPLLTSEFLSSKNMHFHEFPAGKIVP